ncbi:L-2-amino-thiazoline-4-carboxylic acid hydrolase [Paenibacillus sp. N3/727]|uniref:L-2-amino-thiazoline-4-carboxylic acid hydrolase n=1 Tax=Paenibacillus sp. N3/727 TaxID=2925845 RepID=UPI001F52BE2F|nr:L-2-amino-thiazoline-4-carboxylic acid hydrolase [Paenibacillus sp. N3/727]UNK17875.1 L-2-amino-thiazoline-4-carboxylic acid hydrolase [Paenibacillus sp. N3/727]
MNETRIIIPPLSMYAITAKLFTHVERAVVSKYGEQGQDLVQQAVERFGYKDAEDIAKTATVDGENHTLFEYISSYHHTENKYKDLTIYALMAKLFAQLSKAVVDEFGDEGKDTIREGVRTFGEERGRGIAQRARTNGEENTIYNYLSNYDMGRSDLFTYTSDIKPEEIEQNFTACPFGQQWADDDMHEYGILYCEMIDPAVARGYNNKFEVEHDQYVLKEGNCHFRFKLKESESND